MSRSYPERHRPLSADDARDIGLGAARGALVALTLLAIGGLGIGFVWCANHPHSWWAHALTVVLLVAGVALAAFVALAPVAANQASRR